MDGDVRVVILAEELLIARGLESVARNSGLSDALAIESLDRASRLLGSGRRELLVWIAQGLDGKAGGQLAAIRAPLPDLGLLLIVERAQASVIADLLEQRAGSLAVLLRTPSLDASHVVDRMKDSLAGRPGIDPRVVDEMMHRWPGREDALAALTANELQILELVALGLRNREIARRLWKSEKAIEKHVGHLFAKLGLRATDTHLDRRVTAARIYLSLRPDSAGAPPRAPLQQRAAAG